MTWRTDVETWIKSKRSIPNALIKDYIHLFELAFQNAFSPEDVWFGVHKTSVSLVVGQIYLLGVTNDGIWLLIDRKLEDDRINYKVVKSTKDHLNPLIWAKINDLQKVDLLTDNSDIWNSYALASKKIRDFWVSSSRDDEFQTSKGKIPLLDIWQNSSRLESLSVGTLTEKVSEEVGDFDPSDIEDARQRQLRAIVQRRGQNKFRQNLMTIHGARCQITNCDVPDALEAAHIVPYQGLNTNHIKNGLLLRSDIHTLFDLYLISINPENHEIVLSKGLKNSVYQELDGKKLRLPSNTKFISNLALEVHYDRFICKNR
jgi:putative restriction endonuclease